MLKLILLVSSVSLFSLSAKEYSKFSDTENCNSANGKIAAAKHAVELSCEWIEKLGSRSISDPLGAFSKINESRHCVNNYVWVQDYMPGLNRTNYKNHFVMLMHPNNPRLQKQRDLAHKSFGGHKIFEKFNKSATIKPEGCWVPYLWEHKGYFERGEKVSFIKRCFDPTLKKNVVVGAGVYMSHGMFEPKDLCAPEKNPY
ncbi:cache domain-containing protein [Halobacteriovorax sp. HLS]|uniref:cache domain-containing protein n=1 Tax=Halobacteriovorax sp. HLS TaxID=2234000 RepID=UPI000FD8BFF5|nr:cache domain-containing protein [Halobacteriovorax sp. HLS]